MMPNDLLPRLWSANAQQARSIWKESRERGVQYELERAWSVTHKGDKR